LPSLAAVPQPDLLLVALGLLVGALVGLTGVGGGSLLTPLLILVVGARPTVALGTDLAFAALTKPVGAVQHTRSRTADLNLTLWLAVGSVPGALAGSTLVSALEAADPSGIDTLVSRVLGVALILAAAASLVRAAGVRWNSSDHAAAPGHTTAIVLGLGIRLLVGGWLCTRLQSRPLRVGIAVVLAVSGARLL
jgi:uncharacterized protein